MDYNHKKKKSLSLVMFGYLKMLGIICFLFFGRIQSVRDIQTQDWISILNSIIVIIN